MPELLHNLLAVHLLHPLVLSGFWQDVVVPEPEGNEETSHAVEHQTPWISSLKNLCSAAKAREIAFSIFFRSNSWSVPSLFLICNINRPLHVKSRKFVSQNVSY